MLRREANSTANPLVMKTKFTAALFLSLVYCASMVQAQEKPAAAIPAEYESVVSTIQRVISLLGDVTQRHATDPISDQILSISDRLTLSGPATGGFRAVATEDDLIRMLKDVQRELQSISRSLERRGEDDLSSRLNDAVRDLDKAIVEAGDDVRIRRSSDDDYELRSGKSSVRIRTTDEGWWDDDDKWEESDFESEKTSFKEKVRIGYRSKKDDEKESRRRNWDPRSYRYRSGATFAGEFTSRWPFREYGIYRNIESVRYNRVEGLFLGISRDPLEWNESDRGRFFGQVGYGFGTKDWQYEIGAESRFGSKYRNDDFDVKIGGTYHTNTSTNDLWKSSWAENSAAAFFFEHDFFDYYHTEGWTGYAVSRITRFAQLSVGYRADRYTSLSNETSWSLFGNNDFRPNPAIVEGDMRSIVLSLEGGQVRSFNDRPSGGAVRLEAELGQGLGGDFDFSRFVGDVRTYVRLTRDTGLALRFRGGFTEGSVPVQKAFTLGGVGSVRSYHQNSFIGTRMALANAELALYEPAILDNLIEGMSILGLFDAGWTNSFGTNKFDTNDVIASAGFGLAFDDRAFRLEVTWPTRDIGTGMQPSVWLRIAPSF